MRRFPYFAFVLSLLSFFVSGVAADEAGMREALRLVAQESAADVASGVVVLGKEGSPAALSILQGLDDEALAVDATGKVFIRAASGTVDAATGKEAQPSGQLRLVVTNNIVRRNLGVALARAQLLSRDVEVRRAAARSLSTDSPDPATTDLIRELSPGESDKKAASYMALALARVDITSDRADDRIRAARAIKDSDDTSLESQLIGLTSKKNGKFLEPNGEVRREMNLALRAVQRRIFVANSISNTIYGLSLGSVLVFAALGLAITFGLMRVINMAHGEMLMLGAYATFFAREQFLAFAPGAADWYLAAAIPFAFASTFLVGMGLERFVIRHLYGRPLETLLATWGLSLIIIQVVRVSFGAQNVTVANPSWLSGGFELMPALVVPYSRIFVLAFAILVLGFVVFLLRRTSLGLKVRAVTQNREIAASLGIPTHRVDMYTFGLGSGLAGLGGVALSQLGNVGPELGQSHIIDSFMVVVLGGVGNILGTIVAGVGLGLANKVLEPGVGPVLGKIILLGLLILFIQWRPQGLFSLKGRSAGD